MSINVTYLFGAGASYNSLPLVKNIINSQTGQVKLGFSRKMIQVADEINALDILPENRSIRDELVSNLRFFGGKSEKYSSPDTYIKSLWLRKNSQIEIEKAKKTLSFFLILEQFLDYEPRLDSRYIPFLSSILVNQKQIAFPENIKIVSWNYDLQLEIALQYFLEEEIVSIQSHFGIIPGEADPSNLSVVHLNGVSGLISNKTTSTSLTRRIEYTQKSERLNELLRLWAISNRGYSISDLFSFAWEIKESNHKRITLSEKFFSDAVFLVIIGYSFPFFNREVDNRLIKAFIDGPNPEVIYIQDPSVNNYQVNFLRERFEIPETIEIEPINSVDQFFLPPGL